MGGEADIVVVAGEELAAGCKPVVAVGKLVAVEQDFVAVNSRTVAG